MIQRLVPLAAALVVAAPAGATILLERQIVDATVYGAVYGTPFSVGDSDAGVGAGRIAASAQVARQVAAGSVRGSASVIADLTSAERGRVAFRSTLTTNGALSELNGGSTYRYFFTTDMPAAFDLNWGVGAYGASDPELAPSQTVLLEVSETGLAPLRMDWLGHRSSGMTSVTLEPGSYEFRVQDSVTPRAVGGEAAGLSSEYSFMIRTVPEPATWTMLILGFGATGTAVRRSRRALRLA